MNSMMLSVLVLASVLSLTFAALCTPDQWEGSEGSLGGYVHHFRPGIIKEFSKVSYDAKNMRKASTLIYINDGRESKFQMVVKYNSSDEGVAYIVDLEKDKCYTKKMREPFRKACIPDDAKHVADYSLGLAGKGGLPVSEYSIHKKGMEVVVAVNKAGGDLVIPVTESIYGRIWGTAFVQGLGFADITPGIKDPKVFDVPKQCVEEDHEMISEFMKRQNFVMAI